MKGSIREIVASGDHDAAARALLRKWRGRRHPAIAEALDTVSARITREPITARTVAERQELWRTIAAAGDPADIPRLLALLHDGTSETTRERIEALAKLGPDPRVAAALADIVTMQQRYRTKYRFWRAVTDALATMWDVRQIAPLAAALPRDPEGAVRQLEPRGDDRWVFELPRFLLERVPPLIARLERDVIPELGDDELRALAEIGKSAAPAARDEALLQQILADPDDDAPRLVYADALQAHGDPHGELIGLQIRRGLHGRVSARETQLVTALRSVLLGDLEPVVLRPVFRRGFLAECDVELGSAQRSLIEHPLWRTIERLQTCEPALYGRTDLRALRHLAIPSRGGLDELLTGTTPLPRIERLTVWSTMPVADAAVNSAMLPALKHLHICLHARERTPLQLTFANLLAGRIGRGLEEIAIECSDWYVKLDLALWRIRCPGIRIRYELPNFRGYFDGETLHVELRATAENADHAYSHLIRDQVDDPGIRVVVTKAPRGFAPDP